MKMQKQNFSKTIVATDEDEIVMDDGSADKRKLMFSRSLHYDSSQNSKGINKSEEVSGKVVEGIIKRN